MDNLYLAVSVGVCILIFFNKKCLFSDNININNILDL